LSAQQGASGFKLLLLFVLIVPFIPIDFYASEKPEIFVQIGHISDIIDMAVS